MGQTQSKDHLLYQMVINGDIQRIQALYTQGTSLEWKDKEGKTPLIVAAKDARLYDVAKLLIELGANVNAISRGPQGGTPLHYAAKEGLDRIVALLLSHGANAFVKNRNHETPLAIARKNKRGAVVHEIENRICYFAGHVQETFGPGFSDASAPQLSTRVIWVAVVPRTPTNPPKPPKLELVIYSTPQDVEPRTIIFPKRSKIKEPKFDQPNAALIIVDKKTKTRYKFSSVTVVDKQQLRRLYSACKGISQAVPVLGQTGFGPLYSPTKPIQLHASPWSSPIANVPNSLVYPTSSLSPNPWLFTQSPRTEHINFAFTETWTPPNPNQSPFLTTPVSSIPQTPDRHPNPSSISPPPSAPPVIPDIELTMPTPENGTSCVICWEAPAEGACIPCGHVSGCMSCLKKLSDRNEVCPICRSDIHQVVKLYGI